MTHDEAHLELRQAVRAVLKDFSESYWRALDQERAYPEAFVQAMTAAGFLGALIPREYGGLGLGLAEASVILEEVNRCGGNAGTAHAQMYIMGTILRHGSAQQKREYLPKIARGELRLQAFGVTEPEAGTDTTRLRTTAMRRGDHYVVNGRKIFISRVQHSDLMLLLARTTPLDRIPKRSQGLSVFLVDLRDAIGHRLTVTPIRTMLNNETNELCFHDLAIPAGSLIGEEGQGFRYILDGMNAERILVASEAVGDGRWFVRKATQYAKDRVVFGAPIGKNQAVQFPIARAWAELEAADMICRRAAALFDDGKECGADANIAKLLASEAAWKAADTAMQTFGGFSYAREYEIERKWREVRLYQIAPISTNLILGYVGQHVLGMPRSY